MKRSEVHAIAEGLGYDLSSDRIFSVDLGVDAIEVERADLNENGQMVLNDARTGVRKIVDRIEYEDFTEEFN